MSKQTPEQRQIQSLKRQLDRMDRELRSLKDVLNVHDNWNAEVKQLIGKRVRITDTSGQTTEGTMLWSDRYNLCVEPSDSRKDPPCRRIYNKGSIIWIEPGLNP